VQIFKRHDILKTRNREALGLHWIPLSAARISLSEKDEREVQTVVINVQSSFKIEQKADTPQELKE
jgi:hypothetical protein